MAEGGSKTTLEKFREELTCSICDSLFEVPKTLDCLHTFCEKCIEGHVKKRPLDHEGEDSRENLTCPLCRNEQRLPDADVKKLKTNKSYENMVGHLTLEDKVVSEQGVKCTECEESNAAVFCKNCNYPLCEDCKRHHLKCKKTKEHMLLPLNEIRPKSGSSEGFEGVCHNTWMCATHNSEVCMYCIQCDVVICRDCALTDHNNHDKNFANLLLDNPPNPENDYKGQIQLCLTQTDQVLSDFKKAIKDIENMQCLLQKSKTDTAQAVAMRYDEIKAALDKQKAELLKKVKDICDAKEAILEQQLKELQDIAKSLEESLKFTSDILTVGIPEEILFLKTQMVARLKMLCNEYRQYPRDPRDNDIINFRRNKKLNLKDAIGKVEADPHIKAFAADVKNVHMITGELAEFPITCRDIIGNTLESNTHEISVELRPEEGDIVRGEVQPTENGRYRVSVRPQSPGSHRLSIFAHSRGQNVHIKNSPFDVTVTRPPIKTMTASSVIGRDDVPDQKMKSPWGIAVSRDGEIIAVSDIENHCLIVFDQNGRFVRVIGKEGRGNLEFKSPRGLAFNPNGQIVVAEKENHRIQIVTTDGSFKLKFGDYGSNNSQFHGPTGVAVSQDGTIFVTDAINQRIQYFNSNGRFIGIIGQWGADLGMVNEPYAIAIDNRGRILVTERQGCRVQVFERQNGRSPAKYKASFHFGQQGSDGGQLNEPVGIAFDIETNYIYVTELHNQRVSIFKTNGHFVSSFGSYGSNLSEFCNPLGIAVLPGSRVIVADCANSRLMEFPIVQDRQQ